MNKVLEKFIEDHEDEIIAKALAEAAEKIAANACEAIDKAVESSRESIRLREEITGQDVPPHPLESDTFVEAFKGVCNGVEGDAFHSLSVENQNKATKWGDKQVHKQGFIYIGVDPNTLFVGTI